MSKIESIKKYFIIYNQLRRKPSTQKEINDKLEYAGKIDGYNYVKNKRTFKRDLENIESIYNIEIQYSFSKKVYYISDDENENMQQKALETLDLIYAFQLTNNIEEYIEFEKRKPTGTQYLLPLLQAIKNKKIATITHQKFWEIESYTKNIEPLALKEAQNRWYVVAKDEGKPEIKTYGLDRISYVEITKKKFQYPTNFNVKEYFKYYFGVITTVSKDEPEEIILSFHPDQKKYLETMPLHHTQTILVDNIKEYRIQLTIYPTYDFIKEIRSYGKEVKVISPKNLLK
jgi:predicted DNA-binding transcriptional regulator YafY